MFSSKIRLSFKLLKPIVRLTKHNYIKTRNEHPIAMKAMIINDINPIKENSTPLNSVQFPVPVPGEFEVLIEVSTCGVCHTELDEIEGRTPPPVLPIIPGHQIVGKIVDTGKNVSLHKIGDRVGVAWIYSSCGKCEFCRSGQENLCPEFMATGRDAHGGYAEYIKVPENSAYKLPENLSDPEIAPLLCAGAIGFRSLNLTGITNGQTLGLTGFGASAHLVLKLINGKFPDTNVIVFARSPSERAFALKLGAVWAGDFQESPPLLPDAIIDTTPVWKPIVYALKNLKPGGRLVINAIRKEDIDKNSLLDLNYPKHLWLEKEIKSVANVCRSDVINFLEIAGTINLRPEYQIFELSEANRALIELKMQKIKGAKVLAIK